MRKCCIEFHLHARIISAKINKEQNSETKLWLKLWLNSSLFHFRKRKEKEKIIIDTDILHLPPMHIHIHTNTSSHLQTCVKSDWMTFGNHLMLTVKLQFSKNNYNVLPLWYWPAYSFTFRIGVIVKRKVCHRMDFIDIVLRNVGLIIIVRWNLCQKHTAQGMNHIHKAYTAGAHIEVDVVKKNRTRNN